MTNAVTNAERNAFETASRPDQTRPEYLLTVVCGVSGYESKASNGELGASADDALLPYGLESRAS